LNIHSPNNNGKPALQPLACMADHVAAAALKFPQVPAVVFGATRWTYDELDRRVTLLASELLERGVRRGDRVATLSTPRPEFLLLFLAVGKIGAIWMGLNPRYRSQELAWLLADAQPTLVTVLSSLGVDLISVLRLGAETLPTCAVVEFGGGRAGGFTSLDSDAIETVAPVASVQNLSADDPALLVYTSGSTGRPKGALISHYGLTFGSLVQAVELGLTRPTMICNLPINHVGCVADICSVILVQGGTIVFQEKFDAERMFDALEQEHVTIWGGVPSMFQLMVDHPRFLNADLSSVQLLLWGGAAMSRPLIERLQSRGLRLKAAYGMTETSCHVAFTPHDASVEVLEQTIGRPTPLTPCRVVDDAGRHCEAGFAGELQVFGRQNFIGYLNLPEATCAAFTPDGWLKTGDLAAWTPSGELRLVGRLRDVIKSGGYSVYPREIEMIIESHPNVSVCAVVAAPDPLYQEVGVAFVVAKPGMTADACQLDVFLRERLANYKIPKAIVPLHELPLLPIGKVDKNALRALASEFRPIPPGG
jgi:acyl-CoA synthetase (AMP-forming)/AMP-acid ligase II